MKEMIKYIANEIHHYIFYIENSLEKDYDFVIRKLNSIIYEINTYIDSCDNPDDITAFENLKLSAEFNKERAKALQNAILANKNNAEMEKE